jgi:hypothetical protein
MDKGHERRPTGAGQDRQVIAQLNIGLFDRIANPAGANDESTIGFINF